MHFMKLCLVLLLGARSGDLNQWSHLSGLPFTCWHAGYPPRSGTGAAQCRPRIAHFPVFLVTEDCVIFAALAEWALIANKY